MSARAKTGARKPAPKFRVTKSILVKRNWRGLPDFRSMLESCLDAGDFAGAARVLFTYDCPPYGGRLHVRDIGMATNRDLAAWLRQPWLPKVDKKADPGGAS